MASNADYEPPLERSSDLVYWAWTIIANAHEGRWSEATEEWRQAARDWRDAFHAALDAARNDGTLRAEEGGDRG